MILTLLYMLKWYWQVKIAMFPICHLMNRLYNLSGLKQPSSKHLPQCWYKINALADEVKETSFGTGAVLQNLAGYNDKNTINYRYWKQIIVATCSRYWSSSKPKLGSSRSLFTIIQVAVHRVAVMWIRK